MKGEMVPLILIPRYTTYVGNQDEGFPSVPMEMTAYEDGEVVFWRGELLTSGGVTPDVRFHLEASMDAVAWTPISTGATGMPIPAKTPVSVGVGFSKKWFRVRTVLYGNEATVSCWAIGQVNTRVT